MEEVFILLFDWHPLLTSGQWLGKQKHLPVKAVESNFTSIHVNTH